MNPAPISPGWALVAIFLLWGLAGALDQPLDGGEPSEGPAIDRRHPPNHSCTCGATPNPRVRERHIRDIDAASRPSAWCPFVNRREIDTGTPNGPPVPCAASSSTNEEITMDRQTAIRSTPLRDLLPVRSLNDLDWFVKESEIITGNPGREFVVAGADQPTFRIHLDHVGYQIARVDRGDQSAAPVCATAPELVQHALGDALARGQLFTTALQ